MLLTLWHTLWHTLFALLALFVTMIYDVSYLQVDLLSAVAKYAPDNPFIAIFGCILSGSLDPIMFRYQQFYICILPLCFSSISAFLNESMSFKYQLC